MMKALLILAICAVPLAGCGAAGTATEVRVEILKVPVRAKGPDKGTYDALKATRPRPLRDQPMPADPDVRVAKQTAQLGRFEAQGGWADRAEAALDRCQDGVDLPAEPG